MSKKVELFEDDIKKAYDEGDASNKSLLAKMLPKLFSKNIMDRINTIEDVLSLTKPESEVQAIINYEGDNLRLLGAKNSMLIDLITEAYNEGKQPDWDDSSSKFNLVYDMRGGRFSDAGCDGWSSVSGVGSRQTFLKREHALDAFEKFPKVFEGWAHKKVIK